MVALLLCQREVQFLSFCCFFLFSDLVGEYSFHVSFTCKPIYAFFVHITSLWPDVLVVKFSLRERETRFQLPAGPDLFLVSVPIGEIYIVCVIHLVGTFTYIHIMQVAQKQLISLLIRWYD